METLETKVRINGIDLALRRVAQYEGVAVKGVVASTEEVEETFNMDGDDEVTFEAAKAVALGVYGQRRNGEPNCTNSDLWEIWNLMKDVAGA